MTVEVAQKKSREVAFQARALGTLRRSLRREAGALAAIHALQAAGYEAGEGLYDTFRRGVGDDPATLGETSFWTAMNSFLSRRGWGEIRQDTPHPRMGVLASPDWAEAADDSSEDQPSCAFSAGMLAGFLTSAAGNPVAVLQVGCRSAGDDECVFAFGSENSVHELYGHLLDGLGFDAALAELSAG